MTELEAKAKDCIENHTHKLVDKPTKQDIYLREESIFISGYKLGATENGIQWHDLRKDPNDLPEANWKNWVVAVYDGGTLWCRARREECVDGVYWVNSFHYTIENVVLWAKIEIPL